MRRYSPGRLVRTGLAVAAFGLSAGFLAAAPVPADTKPKAPSPAEKLRKDLLANVTLDFDDQPLSLALNTIRDQAKLNLVLDRFALNQAGIDPDQTQVSLHRKDTPTRAALKALLSPYNLNVVLVGDSVLVTTEEMTAYRQMRQRVSVEVEKVEFAAALKQLARETACNLVIDPRLTKEAQTPITLQLEEVPLESAVRLMAELAGLKPVRLGSVLYVTTKATAAELRADSELIPLPPARVVAQDGNGGMAVGPGGIAAPPGVPPAPPGGGAAPPPEAPKP